MTNKGGIVVSVPSRSSTTRSGFGATSVDTEASSDGAGGPCRFCGAELRHTFVDLGMSPLCESYVEASWVNAIEAFYPLRVYKSVVGYGAPGERNTLLSYCGIRTAMAPAGPCRGHLPGVPGCPRGRPRSNTQSGLQCRAQRRELPGT